MVVDWVVPLMAKFSVFPGQDRDWRMGRKKNGLLLEDLEVILVPERFWSPLAYQPEAFLSTFGT